MSILSLLLLSLFSLSLLSFCPYPTRGTEREDLDKELFYMHPPSIGPALLLSGGVMHQWGVHSSGEGTVCSSPKAAERRAGRRARRRTRRQRGQAWTGMEYNII